MCSHAHDSSVDSIQDLTIGDRWFDPQLCQYSFPKIHSSHLCPLFQQSLYGKAANHQQKNIVQSADKKNSRKPWTGALSA